MMVLVIPISAFAESFTVITNKDIYTPDEKAIIVGAIPADAPDGYAVIIKITGPGGECATQNILPAENNSFRSRPVRLDGCGFGEISVSAFYAELNATSTFTISESSSQADAGSRMELRILKNTVLQAQETVNQKVKDLVEGGYVLPEEIAEKYGEGVSQASLALEAIEFGDAAEAKKHIIFALRDFREVLDALSENVARFEQTATDNNPDIVGMYDILQRYYYRLQLVAEKNHVDKEEEFKAAALLLSNIKRMIGEGNYEAAGRNLERVNMILEKIRSTLSEEGESKERLTSETNSTSEVDEELARKLIEIAARYENTVLELLNKTSSDPEAKAKVQEVIALIANARTSIEAGDLESARQNLSAAYHAINYTKKLVEDDEDGNTSASSKGKDSDNDSKESSNDDGEDSKKSGKKGSNRGNSDKEGQ
ncbi:hypothetical protein Ngar_c08090 [Candidatus Nitrososphaera gargensis Ga9.2]|uniref:Uncharacterized protein n=1 Tax=Nitrososphaera gargensis (strain Ga9.2) TaxID=1237085 RepID=K0I902_NITGG|nr:hypothetical protein Ngar_c08090 [Candidatus Nitrososphaera gargensis Ga9.2]